MQAVGRLERISQPLKKIYNHKFDNYLKQNYG
jgi:hypothetical protein